MLFLAILSLFGISNGSTTCLETISMNLSSEILTEQLSRENALDSFKNDKTSDDENKKDFEYIARKLDFSYDEFRKIENLPKKTFMDFKNKYRLISLFVKFSNYLNIERRNFRWYIS